MDDRRIGAPEIVATASVAAFFVTTVLPWFEVSIDGDLPGPFGGREIPAMNGWDAGFFWSGIPFLLGVALVAVLLVPRLAPQVEMSDLPPILPLALGAVAASLVLVKIVIGAQIEGAGPAEALGISIDVTRTFGLLLAFLATLGMVGAGFLALLRDGVTPPAHDTVPPQRF